MSRRTLLLGGALAGWAGGALGCGRDRSPAADREPWVERAWDFPCHHRATSRIRPEVGALHHLALQAESLWAAGSEGLALFDLSGRERLRLEKPFPARALDLDQEGSLWLAGGARVAHLDRTGRLLSTFELSGPEFRRTPLLTDIAVSGESLFLADATNRVIHRLTHDGAYMGSIGEKSSPSGLVVPSPYLSICFDGSGSLLVAHLGRRRVERYAPEGTLLGSWGEPGIRPGAFSGCCNPVGLFVDPAGPVLCAEKGLGRLTWFSAEGRPLSLLGRGVFTPASRNIQVCALGPERVFASDPAAGLIHAFEKV